MTTYNTDSDAANTAVRAFLTKVGEHYLERTFNTGSGTGRKLWIEIRDDVFGSACVYCGGSDGKLQIEHLVMFNREEYGLHHPGNIGPCCKSCNTRSRGPDKRHVDWVEHLRQVCDRLGEPEQFEGRHGRIHAHMRTGKFALPELSREEQQAIRVIAASLYANIKTEMSKSLELYKELQASFVASAEGDDFA